MEHENTVELLGWYGGDEAIALSAWTSTSRGLSQEKRDRIPQMIQSLWKNGHETPFEKGIVHFLANTDIATHIHLLKHRISSLNSESARYKELNEDKFYIPDDWKNVKLGHRSGFVVGAKAGQIELKLFDKNQSWDDILELYTNLGNLLYHESTADLSRDLGRKRAKESARFFKSYNMQYTVDIMFNIRSFANFLKLRNSEHAQLEIREVAQKMQDLVQNIEGNPFEHTLKAITNKK